LLRGLLRLVLLGLALLITHTRRFSRTAEKAKDFGLIADLLGPVMGCFLFQFPPTSTTPTTVTPFGMQKPTRPPVVGALSSPVLKVLA
jgi:hypothetical protein